ncbi:unnamed protein product [Prorocentrum cordatum]|uniref:Ubiquitin thioesterase OTU1 n=1 Tax=Prorocentrum cordatum TaxID=2364126 RepID=A0ABN9SYX5_9DINO|nr:unnamed protein product [Polarella glacialis]
MAASFPTDSFNRAVDGARRFVGAFGPQSSFTLRFLTQQLPGPIRKSHGETPHLFVRPHGGNIIMLDADVDVLPDGHAECLAMAPVVVVATSGWECPNRQHWYVMDPTGLRGGEGRNVTLTLQRTLGTDPNSTAEGQLGRMLGSLNAKPHKQCTAQLVSVSRAFFNAARFYSLTAKLTPRLAVDGAGAASAQMPRAPAQRRAPSLASDASSMDWKDCCDFWERPPHATLQYCMSAAAPPPPRAPAAAAAPWPAAAPRPAAGPLPRANVARSPPLAAPAQAAVAPSRSSDSPAPRAPAPLAPPSPPPVAAPARATGLLAGSGHASRAAAPAPVAQPPLAAPAPEPLRRSGLERAAAAPNPPGRSGHARGAADSAPATPLALAASAPAADPPRFWATASLLDDAAQACAPGMFKRVDCEICKTKEHFSNTQLKYKHKKGTECAEKARPIKGVARDGRKRALKPCSSCYAELGKQSFTRPQRLSKDDESRTCKGCAAQPSAPREPADKVDEDVFDSRAEALRFILTSATTLQSVDLRTNNAARMLHGRAPVKNIEPAGGLGVDEKLALLKKAHEEDLQHSGGADGLRRALVDAMGGWTYLGLDAAFYVARCVACRRSTSRGARVADAPLRHLPGKLEVLNVVWMDLKAMPATDDGAAWTLLVLVDFASGKMWTKDFDAAPAETDAASLSGAQSFLMDWVMSVVKHAPTVWWSDSGGQFKSEINAMVENAFGTVSAFIPPGHPAPNGLTERMNAVLGRLASSRAKLQSVTTALNNACRGRHSCPPEVLHRMLLPRRSTLTHQAVRQHMQAQEAAGAEIDRDSFLAAYTDMVEQMKVDGAQELIDDHASQVGTLRDAISCRQLRIDIGNRLQWSRNSSNKGMIFYTGDLNIHDKYEDGSFEIVGVAVQLLEVRRRGGDAGQADGAPRTIHRDSARLAIVDISGSQGDPAKPRPQTTARLPTVIKIPDDGHCLFSAVAYGAKGIKGEVPSDQRLSATGQAHRKEVAAWIDTHREEYLDDVSVEDVLRVELEDDPHMKADAAWPEISQIIRTPRYFGSGVAM